MGNDAMRRGWTDHARHAMALRELQVETDAHFTTSLLNIRPHKMAQAYVALHTDSKYNPLFADEDADFIIRAGNGTLFRVCKLILKKCSDVFKDMLRLPQPAQGDDNAAKNVDALPVVDIDEAERTLEILLTLCYPVEQPELNDIGEIALALREAVKYEMDVIATILRKRWPVVAATEPLRAFAIACICHLRDEACIAAKLSLQEPIWPLEPPLPAEFRDISAETLLRLQSYHRKCATAAVKCASDTAWCDTIFSSTMCKHCQGNGWTTLLGTRRLHWSDWYKGYTRRAAKALLLQPSSLVVLEDGLVYQPMNPLQCSGMTVHEFEALQQTVKAFSKGIEDVIEDVSR